MNAADEALIAQARAWPSHMGEGWLFHALADALEAARATIENGLSEIDFWLDDGFKRDMAGDAEGRDDAIDIVVQELRKSLGDNA